MSRSYNRSSESLGNILHMEHVNLMIPDQAPAILFYVTGLGFTRDPFLMTGLDNMWINIGRSQIHLPRRDPSPQILRGRIGLVSPNLKFTLKTWNLPPNIRLGLLILNQYMLEVDIQLSSLGTKLRVSNSEFWVWTPKFRVWTCKFRVWTVKFRVWTANFKFEGEISSLESKSKFEIWSLK